MLFACISCERKHKKPVVTNNHLPAFNFKEINLQSFYSRYNLEGMFALYNPETEIISVYNKQYFNQPVTPASTFNITTSLIALEEGILEDPNSMIEVDSKEIFKHPELNEDLRLWQAFQRNSDRAFLKLRQQIGVMKMNRWIYRLEFGNKSLCTDLDTIRRSNNEADLFYVVPASLRITPAQQLDYMKQLFYEQLPFSKKHMQSVQGMMYLKNINGYRLHGKQGSYVLRTENKYIGWHIGWLQTGDKVLFYVNYLQTPNLEHPSIVAAQKDITFKILEQLVPAPEVPTDSQ